MIRKGLQRRFKRTVAVEVTLTITEMFEEFMLVKKGEGLAKRTIQEHYNNFGYFKTYIGKELSVEEMTTELFVGWITYMIEEMNYTPGTVNIRVRTMRAFLRYCYEDKAWIHEPIHKRFKPIKAPIDVVEAFTVLLQAKLMSFSDVEQRVSTMLQQLAASYGVKTSKGLTITIPFTHQELAHVIGSSRVSVSYVMNSLQERGEVVKQNGLYTLLPSKGQAD